MTCRTFPYMVEFDDRGRLDSVELHEGVACRAEKRGHRPGRVLIASARRETREDAQYVRRLRRWERAGRRGGKQGLLAALGLG